MTKKALAFAALMIWVCWLLWASRGQMLDDALIHLRYASMFRTHHFITFNGISHDYGTSSLLYVLLLSAGQFVSSSPLLPKAVSTLAYLGLLACVSTALWKARRSLAFVGYGALLLTLCGPYAARWLTDGMETSLAALLAWVAASAVARRAQPAVLFLLGLLLSVLRVDMSLLVAVGVCVLLVQRAWSRSAALALGSAITLLAIRLTMGHLLPDTALAKVGLGFLTVLTSAGYVTVASCSFGLGLLFLWMVSAYRRPVTAAHLLANAALPALLLSAAIKGQQMQGFRYLLWALLFSITWNLRTLEAVPLRARRWMLALPVVFACAWLAELPSALRIFEGRAETLAQMRHADLAALAGQPMIAGDIGFIGYFTGSQVCDLNGLVNGRQSATLTMDQRITACLAQQPTVLFLSGAQLGVLDEHFGTDSAHQWWPCGTVDFTNVRSNDHHVLMVRKQAFPNGCPVRLSAS